jgi:hypothetical protein
VLEAGVFAVPVHTIMKHRNGLSNSCQSNGLLSQTIRAAEGNGNGNGSGSQHSSDISLDDDSDRPSSSYAIAKVRARGCRPDFPVMVAPVRCSDDSRNSASCSLLYRAHLQVSSHCTGEHVQVDRTVKQLASSVGELAEKQERVCSSLECHVVVSHYAYCMIVGFAFLHTLDSCRQGFMLALWMWQELRTEQQALSAQVQALAKVMASLNSRLGPADDPYASYWGASAALAFTATGALAALAFMTLAGRR